MASKINSTPAPAQQPGLRPFIIYDRLPAGHAAYVVPDNRQLPHLRAGEWVIVDTSDRTPTHGDLFVIQWQTGGGPMIVEAGWNAKYGYWMVGSRCNRFNRGTGNLPVSEGMISGDFPYRTDQLEDRFLGRIVGILEAAFESRAVALCA